MINSNLRLVVSLAAQVPGRRRAVPARPDPGGHPRPHPRRREVRLAQGLPVLHLRDAVDPPGDPARAGRPRPQDPPAGQRRPARAQDRQGRARAVGRAGPRADASRRSPRAAELEPTEVARAARGVARRRVAGPPGRRGGRRLAGRPAAVRRPAAGRGGRGRRCASRPCATPSRRCPSASARSSSCATASTATGAPSRSRSVGRELGVSPERVRQIEERALPHLALPREMQALREAARLAAAARARVPERRDDAPRPLDEDATAAARAAPAGRRRGAALGGRDLVFATALVEHRDLSARGTRPSAPRREGSSRELGRLGVADLGRRASRSRCRRRSRPPPRRTRPWRS